MNTVLLGNIIATIGAIIMVCIGLIRSKRNILLAQSLQFLIMGIGNLVLGGFSGFLSNMLGITRNLVCLRWNLNTPLKVLFIALQTALTLLINHEGWTAFLPVIAATAFTLVLDTENVLLVKSVIIVGQICWTIYDLSIRNYASAAFDIFTIVSNLAGIIMICRKKNSQTQEATGGPVD